VKIEGSLVKSVNNDNSVNNDKMSLSYLAHDLQHTRAGEAVVSNGFESEPAAPADLDDRGRRVGEVLRVGHGGATLDTGGPHLKK
jgi:hypothetical protein